MSLVFFFFQAEDGIRDIGVTGVQTCALPIYNQPQDGFVTRKPTPMLVANGNEDGFGGFSFFNFGRERSEERRVGKECRSWWVSVHSKKKDSVLVQYCKIEKNYDDTVGTTTTD